MKRTLFALFALLAALALAACTPDQAATLATTVAGTLTSEAQMTAAAPSDTPLPAPTDTPTATTAPSPTPNEVAPDPLPATHTGIVLSLDECFDFDSGQVVAATDSNCDMWLKESVLIEQMNGSQISGYVTFAAPTRTECINATFDPNDLAIQTDLYMCFHTTEGGVGFVVARDYVGGVPFTGFIFDYWVFD